jgi:L-amino acid N-acyltransferase YncA
MPDPITGSPVTYPTVSIGGATYTLRFSFLAELVADELKLDVRALFDTLRSGNVGKLSAMMKLFSAMVAHNFVSLRQDVPTPEQWAARLEDLPDDERMAKFQDICQAVGDCLRAKIQASAAVRLQEPMPTQERAN